MSDAFIALGSNIGDRQNYLKRALDLLKKSGRILSVAGIYESTPYGYQAQPPFLNSIVALETNLQPQNLLSKLKGIEAQLGRVDRGRWKAREIDLDIIFYDDLRMATSDLIIPHPDFQNRRFVLEPLADVAPDFISPIHQKTVTELLADCQDETEIKFFSTDWCKDEFKV